MAGKKDHIADMEGDSIANPPIIGIDVALRELFEEVTRSAESSRMRKLAKGVQSGFCGLDMVLGGFRRNELAIVAGAPGCGMRAMQS